MLKTLQRLSHRGWDVLPTRRDIKAKSGFRKSQLRVLSLSASAKTGWLALGSCRVRCALGRSGQRALKREGDGATPIGGFRLLKAYYRSDRLQRPPVGLPLTALRRDDGWCDAVSDRNYNRHVRHPYAASAEKMWRDDGLYDVVVVLDYNIRPRARGLGSAIFLHCARQTYAPTEGCVAVERRALVRILSRLSRRTTLTTRRA